MSLAGRASDWKRLFRIARSLIQQVNAEQIIVNEWTFGGGTAMMIQIDHRESHDVDIFLPDPQFLPYLDPRTHDFDFEIQPADYDGDGSGFLKLAFKDVGEIDFIVGHALTASPTKRQIIEGECVELETIAEIIAKKIYHRGANIKPRDIFDVAAAGLTHRDEIVASLKSYPDQTAAALDRIKRLNPDFVSRSIEQLAIKDSHKSLVGKAIASTRDILLAAAG